MADAPSLLDDSLPAQQWHSAREIFGIDSDLQVPVFTQRDDHVPAMAEAYRFNPDVTLAILAGFTRNRRPVHRTPRQERCGDL